MFLLFLLHLEILWKTRFILRFCGFHTYISLKISRWTTDLECFQMEYFQSWKKIQLNLVDLSAAGGGEGSKECAAELQIPPNGLDLPFVQCLSEQDTIIPHRMPLTCPPKWRYWQEIHQHFKCPLLTVSSAGCCFQQVSFYNTLWRNERILS